MTDTADAQIADDLYDLTELMARNGHDAAHGFLGGDWGYGAEHDCAVFEMHPFWWGDCECGHEEREGEWEEANPHADNCYQSELQRRGRTDDPEALAVEWGLPRFGCAVHCTCGQRERWIAWNAEHDHDPACPTVRPNFRHKASGLEVRWYKYLGRNMEISERPTLRQWAQVVDDCRAAVAS